MQSLKWQVSACLQVPLALLLGKMVWLLAFYLEDVFIPKDQLLEQSKENPSSEARHFREMGWAHAGQEQESRCWRGPNTPVPSSLTNGVPLVSHPGMGWNRKALGSVMKHCGSPAQDHFLWWLLNCCLGRIYFRELLRDPAPTEILIAFENPGFC